jgi:hypothetical protein
MVLLGYYASVDKYVLFVCFCLVALLIGASIRFQLVFTWTGTGV